MALGRPQLVEFIPFDTTTQFTFNFIYSGGDQILKNNLVGKNVV